MRELNYIELVLENCESIRIDRDNIGQFQCGNIRRSVLRRGCNSIAPLLECDTFFVEIHRDANKECEGIFPDGCGERQLPFVRLISCPDVTWVSMNYDDGSEESISLPWDSSNEDTNLHQETYLSKCGHLYLLVSETGNINREIERLHSRAAVDDEEYMSEHWNLMGHGEPKGKKRPGDKTKKVQRIELSLENGEDVPIEAENIAGIRISGICQGVGGDDQGIALCKMCEEMLLMINKDRNLENDPNLWDNQIGNKRTSTFVRLERSADIVAVYLYYSDGSADEVYVPWIDSDPEGCSNRLQTAYIAQNGDLYIAVSRTISAREVDAQLFPYDAD